MRALLSVVLFLLPAMVSAQGGLVAWPAESLGPNLVANGTFEDNLDGWTITDGVTRDCTEAYSGSCSMKITDICNVSYVNTQKYALSTKVGGYYRMTAWVKYVDLGSASPVGGIRLGISTPYGSNGGGGVTGVMSGTSDWVQKSLTTVLLNTATLAFMAVEEYNSSYSCGEFWIDDVVVVEELVPKVEAKLIQPSYRGYLWSDMDQEAIFEVTNNLGYIPVDAQDETSYDDSPTTEGTFSGGTGHNVSDVITLEDGTEITVDAESGNVVTQFTVDVADTWVGNASGATISQESTTGSGTGFSLTTGDDNVTNTIEQVVDLDPPGSPSISDATITDGKVTVAIAADGTIAFRNKGQETPDYPEYRIETQASSARATWPLSWTDDNRFRINDTPTFIVGAYDSGMGYSSTEAGFDALFDNYRRLDETAGDFDGYLNYWWGELSAANLGAMMDSVSNSSHQIPLYWQTANCFGSSLGASASFPAINNQTYAEAIATNDVLAGLYVMDECVASLADDMFAKTSVARDWIPKGADLAVALPASPTVLETWYDVADIIATDPYPLYGEEPAGGYLLNKVASAAQNTRLAVSDARPFLMVLQFFQFTTNSRWPTEAELRNMSIMAITEGAQGIFYWSLGAGALAYACSPSTSWCEDKVEYWGRLKNVISELSDFQSVLVAADDDALLDGVDNDNIQTLGKTGDYVFAYNDTNTTQVVTFTWNTGVSAVVAKNEGSPDRSITPSGVTWSDSFGAYEGHIYAVTDGSPPAGAELDRLKGFATSTGVRVVWSDAALDSDVSCSAVLKNAGGSTLDTNVLSEGFSTRSTGFDGLTPETVYSVTVSCTGYEDAIWGFNTTAALTGTATYSITLYPNEVLASPAKAKVEYRIPGESASSVTDGDCALGCTVDLTLNRGALYEIRHQWLTSGDAVISTSDWRNVTVQ